MGEPHLQETVAGEIRAELGRRQWTKAMLAKATGIPATTIGRKLNGDAPMGLTDLQLICDALEMPYEQFLSRNRCSDDGLDLTDEYADDDELATCSAA